MRIVYTVLGKDIAGGEVVCLQLMRTARERGHYVCILVPDVGSVMSTAQKEGFEVNIFPLERTFQLYKAVSFARFLKNCKADLVHTHTTLPGMVLARIGSFLARVPIICHVHLDHSYNQNPLVGMIQRIADNLTAHFCEIVAVSNDTRQALISVGNPAKRIRVIPNGINIINQDFESKNPDLRRLLGIAPNTKIIGCVARLDPIKGQRDLLRAGSKILREWNKLAIVLIGSDIATGGRFEAELRLLAKQQRLAESVYFAGYQPQAADLVNDFDVFVLPSYREAMPMSILEAMAAAKPVVATAVNGVPEIVIDGATGFLVPPSDLDALAEAILKLLRDPELARTMGETGRVRVQEHFNLNALHERIFALYMEVTTNRHG